MKAPLRTAAVAVAAIGFAAAVPTTASAVTPGGNGELSYTVKAVAEGGHPSGAFIYEPYGATERALPAGDDHAWGPGGETVVYATPAGIILHRLDDPDADVAVTRAGGDADPSISSDGTLVAFERDGKIWVVAANGGVPTELVPGADPVFRPYGHEIGYVDGGVIKAIEADGTRPSILLEPTVPGATLSRPDWSPRNHYVIAQQDAGGTWTMPVKDLITGAVEELPSTSAPGCERAPLPIFGPATQRIAYVKAIAGDNGCEERIEVLRFSEIGEPWVIGEVAGRTSTYEHLAWRPTDRPPTAVISASPSAPLSGQPVTFTLDEVGDPDGMHRGWTWDVDGDGHDDGEQAAVTTSFATPGTHAVSLRLLDNLGRPVIFETSVAVGNRAPTATISMSPGAPQVGQEVAFTATGADTDGQVTAYAWDLDGDGQYDDGAGAMVKRTYAAAGQRAVAVRVTDDRQATGTATRTVTVTGPVAQPEPLPTPVPEVPVPTPPAGGGPATPAPGAGAPGARPRLTLTLRRDRLGVVLRRGLRLDVAMAGSGRITAAAQLSKATARRLRLPASLATAEAGSRRAGRQQLVLRFTRRARAVLAQRRSVTLTVVVVAVDGSLRRAEIRRALKLRA